MRALMLRAMNATAVVGLVLLGLGIVAVVQEEPLQVWLFILAPVALIAIALLLHIADGPKADEPRSDSGINPPWVRRSR